MFKINENFLHLSRNYLFSTISKKIDEFTQLNPNADIIRLGIGDVTQPLSSSIIDVMHRSVNEMSRKETLGVTAQSRGITFFVKKLLRPIFSKEVFK